MLLLSENGLTVDMLPIQTVQRESGSVAHANFKQTWTLYGSSHALAVFTSEKEAKARIADVVEWMNASSFRSVAINATVNPEYNVAVSGGFEAAVDSPFPVVYDLGKEIRYWKQPR